jgi:TP901 family phage tail tape measure protein
MAVSTSAYKILMEAKLRTDSIEAQLKAISAKSVFLLRAQFADGDFKKLDEKIQGLMQKGNQIGKISIFGDDKGGINKAILQYTDALGKSVQQTVKINSEVKITQKYVDDIAKREQEIVRLRERSVKLAAQQKDEMASIANNANRFLEETKNRQASPELSAARSLAEQINQAYSEGNIKRVRELNDQLDIQKASVKHVHSAWNSWTESMKMNMKMMLMSMTNMGLIFGTLNQLKQGIQYITDLNKEMTNIQIVTGFDTGTIGQLAIDYNDLGKELGATTIEVAKSSTEWFRQGKTIAETQELIRGSMMMSKLANMDSAQATEYLTSIINGFKLEATDVEDVLSKLVALDNAYATSVSEISSAMQRSSVSAQQAGVSLEELASMITVVSDVTRRAPESIGEAFKTMFARFQDILAGQVDEDGLGINNVAKSLARVGISIRDTSGGFRDFSSVLDELYGKWQGINEIEQANILKAMAGIRQRETLLVLLENETKYRQALTETENAQGLAQQRYQIYLEGVEAAQNRAKASVEGMWQKTISSEAIKFFYDATAAVFNLMSALGGLQNVIGLVALGLVLFNSQVIGTTVVGFISSIWSLVSGFIAFVAQAGLANAALGIFNTLLYTNPLGLVLGALTLLVGGFVLFNETLTESIAKAEEFYSNLQNLQNEISKLNKDKSTIIDLHEELKNATAGSEEWYNAQSKLKDILPELNGHYDDQGGFIIENAEALDALLELKEKEIELIERKAALEARKGYKEEIDVYKELIEQQEFYIGSLNKIEETGMEHFDLDEVENLRIDLEDTNILLEESELRLRGFFDALSAADQQAFLNAVKGTEIYDTLTKAVEKFHDKAGDTELPAMEISTSPEASEESQKALDDVLDMVVDMIKQKKKAEIDAIKDELDAFKDYIDKQKQLIRDVYEEEKRLREEKKIALDRELEDARFLMELQQEAAKEELDSYNDIIDAQIRLLREKQRAIEYDRKQNENQDELSDLESEIAVLALDDSAEAIARRMELEEEAINLRTQMENDAEDESFRLQEEALENERRLAEEKTQIREQEFQDELLMLEREHELRTRELEDEQRAADEAYEINIRRLEDEYAAKEASLQAKIEQIQNYLDQEGTIINDAMNMIVNKNKETYDQLLEWNKVYGTGINDDVISAWNLAIAAVEAYKLAMADVAPPPSGGGSEFYGNDPLFNSPSPGNGYQYDPNEDYTNPTGRHSGVKTGPVGGRFALKSNEEFAKLLDTELVINADQMNRFMTRTLPQMVQNTNNGGNIEINMPIQCAGNLDRSVLPDIDAIVKKAVKQLNDNLSQRGFTRNVSAFSTG